MVNCLEMCTELVHILKSSFKCRNYIKKRETWAILRKHSLLRCAFKLHVVKANGYTFRGNNSDIFFIACLKKVQEELLHHPGVCVGVSVGVGISKMLKFSHLSFLFDGQGADRRAILPSDRSCCLPYD